MLRREDSRELFKSSGMKYEEITPYDLQRLRNFINEEMISSGYMMNTFRCKQRGRISSGAYGLYIEIRCKSNYFENREAVSFNTDGFVGFAGWADDENIQPILKGFNNWMDHYLLFKIEGNHE